MMLCNGGYGDAHRQNLFIKRAKHLNKNNLTLYVSNDLYDNSQYDLVKFDNNIYHNP